MKEKIKNWINEGRNVPVKPSTLQMYALLKVKLANAEETIERLTAPAEVITRKADLEEGQLYVVRDRPDSIFPVRANDSIFRYTENRHWVWEHFDTCFVAMKVIVPPWPTGENT